ncbi:MAG TPA: 2-dehydropantoate 2-reductase [Burkholderiales bacterium]|nr:2-dehydropantoate 2-reductase [Burkholderiales bacterium]
MRIGVMGAGAVGCYYGAMLALAGHEVRLVGRSQHVAAMRDGGLRLEIGSKVTSIPVEASTDAAALRDTEVVLFCVKSTDTDRAAAAMAPHLGRDTVVLSLQNGVDNPERLAAALAQEVIGAVVYVATEMAGPGHVRHHGRGDLVIGMSPSTEKIAAAFRAAGVRVDVSDNVVGTLWAKLIVNCAYNALSAIAQLPYGRLVQGEGVPAVMRDVVDECLAVANAAGVQVPGDSWQAAQRIAQSMPGQLSSTAQDLARGKPTEIDHLNGFVARKGEALGVATPVNRTLAVLVKLLEAR